MDAGLIIFIARLQGRILRRLIPNAGFQRAVRQLLFKWHGRGRRSDRRVPKAEIQPSEQRQNDQTYEETDSESWHRELHLTRRASIRSSWYSTESRNENVRTSSLDDI